MDKADFHNVLISIATDFEPKRNPFLFATLTNLVSNAHGLEIHLLADGSKEVRDRAQAFEPILQTVMAIALITRNKIIVVHGEENVSVGKRKADWIRRLRRYRVGSNYASDVWMNVDDDMIIPARSLDLIQRALIHTLRLEPLLYSNYDVINTRKYADWQQGDTPVHSLLTIEPRSRPFRLWGETSPVVRFALCPYICPTFILPLRWVTDEMLDVMGSLPKGERGYDILFGEKLDKKWMLILGADSYHVGVIDPFLDGKQWVDVNQQLKDRGIVNANAV